MGQQQCLVLYLIVLDKPWDIEKGISYASPLVFYYGHLKPLTYSKYYKSLVERLAKIVEVKANMNHVVAAAGLFINSMGKIDCCGHELLLHQIETFGCDMVITIGQDKSYNQLSQYANLVQDRRLDIIKILSSGGLVIRSLDCRKVERKRKVHDYFYGVHDTLEPIYVNVNFILNFNLYQIEENIAPTSSLPINGTELYETFKTFPIRMSTSLENTLLAISHATTFDQASIVSVAGFIQILDVDIKTNTVLYKAPNKEKICGKVVVVGDFKI